jgi:hypothetical protein
MSAQIINLAAERTKRRPDPSQIYRSALNDLFKGVMDMQQAAYGITTEAPPPNITDAVNAAVTVLLIQGGLFG